MNKRNVKISDLSHIEKVEESYENITITRNVLNKAWQQHLSWRQDRKFTDIGIYIRKL